MRPAKTIIAVLGVALTAAVLAEPTMGPGSALYASDAFPGFDRIDSEIRPSKKTPRWFAWATGPKMTNAVEQLAWARSCSAMQSWGKAVRAYDALVRNWPTAPEAPVAQLELARLCLGPVDDSERAFEEYRYLLDFYAQQSDAAQVARELFLTVKRMRKEGKSILFFNFKNSTDVRRAFESAVLRAPGADFAAEALLNIAELREEEHDDEDAIRVYEHLINVHPQSPEARAAVFKCAGVRMRLMREHEYNRDRCKATVQALRFALAGGKLEPNEADQVTRWIGEANRWIEEEAYRAAKFYDSRMRKPRGAIAAYENFLSAHPASPHAEEVRERLRQLRDDRARAESGAAATSGDGKEKAK